MKLLIFATNDFYSKPNRSFHLLTSFIEDFLSAGNDVIYVGMAEKGIDKHIPDKLLHYKGFHYSLIKTKHVKKNKFILRYMHGIMYALKAQIVLKKYVKESDVVFVRSSPTVLFNLLAIRSISKNIQVLYGIQDMFPGSTIAAGKMPNKVLQKIFYSLQKIAYKQANIITVISDDMKNKLIEQDVSIEKIKVIVNWFDDLSVMEIPREENLFIKKYNLQENIFYVQYAGTMGFVFDYLMVLNIAELLKDYKDIVFQMIGAGSQKDEFIKEANRRKLDNIVFLPLEEQEMVPHVYSACDICLIPLKKGIIGNSVPSKAGLLMACKRAIVSTVDEESDYFRMINEEHIGIACSTNDAREAANAILKMKNEKDFRDYCAKCGYEYGKKRYSRSENTKKFIKLIEEMAGVKYA